MDSGYICDWHSALFYTELSWGVRIARFFVPDISASDVMKGVGKVAFFFLSLSIHYIVYELLKKHRIYLMLLPLLFIALLFFNKVLSIGYWGNLSYFFLVALGCFFPLCKLLTSSRCFVKLCGIVGVIILCVHVIEFRRNAWLVLPFVIFFITRLIGNGWKKQVISTLLMLLTVACVDSVVIHIIHPKVMHSTSVMLIADTKIASILCNQREREKMWLMEHCSVKSPSRTEYKLRANSNIAPVDESQYDIIRRVALTDSQWHDLSERYVQYWKSFPREMLYARLLSVVHLFWSVKTPEWLQSHLVRLYPHLSERNFGYADGPVWENTLPPFITVTLWLSVVVLTVILVCYTKKKNGHICQLDAGIMLSCAVAFVYIASHLVIVPAPFIRYFAPANFVFVMLIPLIVLRLINIYIDTKRELA